MPILPAFADAVTRRLPKVISPQGHAIADYFTIAVFAAAGGLLWKNHRRAAKAALLCGGAELVLDLLTDYPGGIAKLVGFRAHGKIDLGLAALAATMPELLSFREERGLFLTQAGVITGSTNLTNFEPARHFEKKPLRFA